MILAFPAGISKLIPAYDDIPREFKTGTNPWVKFQRQWFYGGLQKMPKPKPGVDIQKAMRHLMAIQGRFEPKHEHKEAAVAFLASQWLVAP